MKVPEKLSKTMSHHAGDSMLADELHDLIDSAEAFLRATASYSGVEVETARARVKSQLDAARQHVDMRRGAKAYRRVTDAAKASGQYVREHKWQSAGALAAVVALAGGIYAGLHWASRNGRR